MDEEVQSRPRKGRGAVTNPAGRYEAHTRHDVDDGWDLADDDLPPLRTTVTDESPRTIIARNTSPDIFFDRSINPYKGCEHGCVYCYARPTHAWMGLSPGLDFESRLFAKPDAAKLLDAELRRKGYKPATLMIGANTDPYQPIERTRRITRGVLEVLAAFNHPTALTTKSALVLRDLDILVPMAEKGLATVAISVTTLDRSLARTMEPRASTPERRLDAIRALSDAGVPVMVMAAPMIPFLNDSELEGILAAAADAGAVAASYVLLRLPLEIKDLFTEWLEAHHPNKASHVLGLLRESREGSLYVADFGSRMRGTGVHAELLAQRHRLACKRLGLTETTAGTTAETTSGATAGATAGAFGGLRTDLFRPPPRAGDQLDLF